VFNVSSLVAAREAGPAVMVFVLFFLLNIPLDVVQRVQRGHQEGYATNFWTVIGSLAGLGGLLIVMQRKGGLPWLILAILGGQIFAILGNWVQEFGFARPELLPKWAYWDTAAARKIVNTGVMFFLLQSLGVFTIPLDNIIIAQILGPAAVSQYAVPFRLFLLVMSVAAMFVAPLWPAYGEALARGEVKWVRSTLYRSLGYSALIFGPVVVGLAGFGRGIMHIWVGKQVEPTQALLLGMAVWTMLAVLGNAISTFLCGVNALKAYLEIAALQAIANVVLKIVMAKAFGLPGVIWAAVFAALLGLGVLSVYAHKGSLRGIMFPPRRSVRGEG
jgi:O-antigen/teichoic acid export membrane protein